MSVNGLGYIAALNNVTVTSGGVNLWEILPGASVSVTIKKIRIALAVPVALGVEWPGFCTVSLWFLTTVGTGGLVVVPEPQHPRMVTAPLTTFNSLVTSPGTQGNIISASEHSTVGGTLEFREFLPSSITMSGVHGGIGVAGALGLAVNVAPLVSTGITSVQVSSEIYFEEF